MGSLFVKLLKCPVVLYSILAISSLKRFAATCFESYSQRARVCDFESERYKNGDALCTLLQVQQRMLHGL